MLVYGLKINQKEAIRFIQSRAISEEAGALPKLLTMLKTTNGSKSVTPGMLSRALLRQAKITICFHPDRVTGNGDRVIDRLIDSGMYTNQFVTHISNGGVTAFPGGERDIWEWNMFGGAYHSRDTMEEDRPKYGALNPLNFMDGAAPRFGSCCLVLNASVIKRATFSFGDSSTSPDTYGTATHFAPVLFAVLDALTECGKLLDCVPMSINEAIEGMLFGFPSRMPVNGRENCHTIEAHIHGSVSLLQDVDAIHVDASFANTDIHERITRLCEKYDIRLCWIPKRHVFVEDIDDEFRGPLIKPIARRVLEELRGTGRELTAWRIGRGAQSVVHSPGKWSGFGDEKQMLQYIKQLWHIVANFGCPSWLPNP